MSLVLTKLRLAIAGAILGSALAAFIILSLMLVSARMDADAAEKGLAVEIRNHDVTRASLNRATSALSGFMAEAEAQRKLTTAALRTQKIRDEGLSRQIDAIRAERAADAKIEASTPKGETPTCKTPDAIIIAKGL